MASFFLKQDDTAPVLAYTTLDENKAVIVLTGATVTFYMQDENGIAVITAAAVTIVDAANGKVEYSWVAADSDVSGIFSAEFVITFGDGTIRTSPDPGWITVVISGSIRGD